MIVEIVFSIDDLGIIEMLFLIGNGYFGMCGNLLEGCDFFSYGIYINGFYEIWDIYYVENVYGFVCIG